MNKEHLQFVNSLIGLPWENGSKGPHSYDCWSMTQVVQKTLFNRDLPDVNVDADDLLRVTREILKEENRINWKKVEKPSHGSVVEMSSGKHPFHVGVYLKVDGGGILHCQKPAGVVFDRLSVLHLAGWRKLRYNDWTG